MTRSYSALALLRHAVTGHRHWPRLWRNPGPAAHYDVVIVGGGGHGLATAYYLAKQHGIRKVAVLEKAWIGGGNSGRNTQVTRSNYYWPQSAAFYERSLRLFEGLSHELNFNVMLSQRGILTLAHSEHELEHLRRWTNAILVNGVDSRLMTPAEIRRRVPLLNLDGRHPVAGGFIQERGGISRHDAVVWGYARAADALGVDLVQRCEVTGFSRAGGRIRSVTTTRGEIAGDHFVLSAAADTATLAAHLGFQLPLSSMSLQAMVSEPIRPCLDVVVMSPTVHGYASQSDRGEIVMGGAADGYASHARRGSLAITQQGVASVIELFPAFSQLRLVRQWAGTVDITPDTTPLMGRTPVENAWINCGWGTGGYKAIPAGGETMAWSVANGEPHPLIRDFGLDRFERGALIDEGAAAGVAH